jgi:NADPH:quinone reductase-like Zn-dependent oxidoreductase
MRDARGEPIVDIGLLEGSCMKAVIFTKYGSPDVLELREVEKPTPRDDEVLIRVHAASLNDWDWEALRGTPFVNRLMFGLLKPRKQILGSDIAGRVEAVGRDVRQLQLGDEVLGDLSGGYYRAVSLSMSVLVRVHLR